MEQKLLIYNTLSRSKELFKPLHAPHVGMYVCGPTVYGDPHLGHARPAITFDVLFRYLKHLNYKVRYVRNITDVGHLEHDADDGDDKIAKKARLDQLEPMEIAQSVEALKLKHVVLTSVDRDDIKDFGASHWVKVIRAVKQKTPNVTMEVLIPDFQGHEDLVSMIIEAKPEVISHNLETVRRLSPHVRSRATYDTSKF